MSMSMSVLVLDNGGAFVRAGLSNGEDLPVVLPNTIARMRRAPRLFVADETEGVVRDPSQLRYTRPIERGFLVDCEAQVLIWERLLSQKLTSVDAKETTLLLSAPPFMPAVLEADLNQMVFDRLGFKALRVITGCELAAASLRSEAEGALKAARAIAASMSLQSEEEATESAHAEGPLSSPALRGKAVFPIAFYVTGTGVVVDAGFSGTTVTPFVGWRPVPQGIRRLEVGGKVMTNYLKELISFRQYNMMDDTWLVNQVKERLCFVAQSYQLEMAVCRRLGAPQLLNKLRKAASAAAAAGQPTAAVKFLAAEAEDESAANEQGVGSAPTAIPLHLQPLGTGARMRPPRDGAGVGLRREFVLPDHARIEKGYVRGGADDPAVQRAAFYASAAASAVSGGDAAPSSSSSSSSSIGSGLAPLGDGGYSAWTSSAAAGAANAGVANASGSFATGLQQRRSGSNSTISGGEGGHPNPLGTAHSSSAASSSLLSSAAALPDINAPRLSSSSSNDGSTSGGGSGVESASASASASAVAGGTSKRGGLLSERGGLLSERGGGKATGRSRGGDDDYDDAPSSSSSSESESEEEDDEGDEEESEGGGDIGVKKTAAGDSEVARSKKRRRGSGGSSSRKAGPTSASTFTPGTSPSPHGPKSSSSKRHKKDRDAGSGGKGGEPTGARAPRPSRASAAGVGALTASLVSEGVVEEGGEEEEGGGSSGADPARKQRARAPGAVGPGELSSGTNGSSGGGTLGASSAAPSSSPSSAAAAGAHVAPPPVTEEDLSDAQILVLASERISVPEALFRPGDVALRGSGGLHCVIADAIEACPLETQAALWAGIVLVGGNALLPGLQSRLALELAPLAPAHIPVHLHTPPDPQGAAWRGGVWMARQPSFSASCVTRQRWEEEGHRATRKAFRLRPSGGMGGSRQQSSSSSSTSSSQQQGLAVEMETAVAVDAAQKALLHLPQAGLRGAAAEASAALLQAAAAGAVGIGGGGSAAEGAGSGAPSVAPASVAAGAYFGVSEEATGGSVYT